MPEAERMQMHLAYIRSQIESGKVVLVEPLAEQNRIRGIATGHPLVQSGRLTVEVHPIMLEHLSSVKFDYPATKITECVLAIDAALRLSGEDLLKRTQEMQKILLLLRWRRTH